LIASPNLFLVLSIIPIFILRVLNYPNALVLKLSLGRLVSFCAEGNYAFLF
jgi:hypothetical protein